MSRNKTIFITVSRGGIIRNILRTGVVSKLLEHNFRVVLLTPYYDMTELFSDFKDENLFIEPLFWTQNEKMRGIIKELCKGVVFNSTVYARYRYSIGTHKQPNLFLLPIRMIFFAPLRYIPGARSFIRRLYSTVNPLRAHDYLFKKYKPSLVFNTAAGGDCGVLGSAKRFGVTTVDMPKSWDNLSQALFPVKADLLIVWNDFMREKALQLQGYSANEVIVTGIPQFDFYARKDGLLSREEFCKKFKLDPRKKIILYGSSGANLFDESKYVFLIREYMKQGKLAAANILVRPHLGYRGDAQRFLAVKGEDDVVIDTSDKQNYALRDNYDTSKEHIYNLFNSVYHADVCVNAASTLSLDAIACGTEVINFNFDIKHFSNPNASVRRLFISDYVKNLMLSDGTWLAKNEEEFLSFLKDVLEKGKRKNTKNMIDTLMYEIDGKSAGRIAEALVGLLDKKCNE